PVEAGRPLFSVDTSRMDACDRMGFGSEWATAFGLALKMTKGQFAPRDGKPRDPAAGSTLAPAEVVDIDKAVAMKDEGGRMKDEVNSSSFIPHPSSLAKEEVHA